MQMNAHRGQVRKSGEPYIIHPLCVAIILADLELDKETIVAGLLHDVVEDTVMTDEEITTGIRQMKLHLLVDRCDKAGTVILFDADKVEVQAENLRKMFLAMAKDIRVILIKLSGSSAQYAYIEIYEAGEAEGKGEGNHGYLCANRPEAWYFQDQDRTGRSFPEIFRAGSLL